MPKTTNIPDEMEELSRLLDEMGSGQQPQSNTQEITELLAIANLIKNAEIPVNPPQLMIDQTVDKVMSDLTKNNTKRRHTWLYSGTLGTAAAVLLVIGLNLTTIWPNNEPVVVLPPATNLAVQEIAPDKSVIEPPRRPEALLAPASLHETAAPKVAVNSTPVPTVPPAVTVKLAPANTEQPTGAAKPAPIMAARAITANEYMLTEKLQKSAVMYKQGSTMPRAVLSLPDKIPDSVITDKESGTIRQVYAKDTPRELIITQQALTSNSENIIGKASASATPDIAKDATQAQAVNKVTLNIHGQQVTLEGRQSEQELLKLAQTLKP